MRPIRVDLSTTVTRAEAIVAVAVAVVAEAVVAREVQAERDSVAPMARTTLEVQIHIPPRRWKTRHLRPAQSEVEPYMLIVPRPHLAHHEARVVALPRHLLHRNLPTERQQLPSVNRVPKEEGLWVHRLRHLALQEDPLRRTMVPVFPATGTSRRVRSVTR